jgi:hypothetical protein
MRRQKTTMGLPSRVGLEMQSDEDGEPNSGCDDEYSCPQTVRGGDPERLTRETAGT